MAAEGVSVRLLDLCQILDLPREFVSLTDLLLQLLFQKEQSVSAAHLTDFLLHCFALSAQRFDLPLDVGQLMLL